jgi:hypothetical protein
LENLKGQSHLEDPGVDGRIILEWILGWEVVKWIHLAEDKDQLQTPVNTVMDLQVP